MANQVDEGADALAELVIGTLVMNDEKDVKLPEVLIGTEVRVVVKLVVAFGLPPIVRTPARGTEKVTVAFEVIGIGIGLVRPDTEGVTVAVMGTMVVIGNAVEIVTTG